MLIPFENFVILLIVIITVIIRVTSTKNLESDNTSACHMVTTCLVPKYKIGRLKISILDIINQKSSHHQCHLQHYCHYDHSKTVS